MGFDSVSSLRSFLLILTVLTIFVLLNMIWSAGFLYKAVTVDSAIRENCEGNCYNTGRKHDTMIERITMVPAISNSNKSAIVQPTNRTSGLNPSQSKNSAHVNSNNEASNRPDTCNDCFEHNFKYIIQNEDVCSSSINTTLNSTSIKLIVLVFTVHDHLKQREVIRKTWLSLSREDSKVIRHVFLLGDSSDRNLCKNVELENNVYHDIIKESFVDSYKNLTYKTIMGFKWVKHFCSNVNFVMKIDDDMYANLPAILKILEKEKTALQTSISGACHLIARPIRNPRSKWYASVRNYPRNSYPGFCSGTGYVTSRNVAEKVYDISKHVPFFYLEDVYVALCVQKLGFKLRPLPGFHNYRTKLDPCEMKSDRILTSHQIPTDFLIKVRDAKC